MKKLVKILPIVLFVVILISTVANVTMAAVDPASLTGTDTASFN